MQSALHLPQVIEKIHPNFTLDGVSGTLYVTTNGDRGQLWRSFQPWVQDGQAVQWDALHDFGETLHVEILASGWSPNGQALYANLKDVTQANIQKWFQTRYPFFAMSKNVSMVQKVGHGSE